MHPTLLHFGHLTLPTFGALAALGLMLALTLSERTARTLHLPPEPIWNAGIFSILAAFLSSRLLLLAAHFATFARFPILLLTVPSLTPAGLILTLAATLLWLRAHRLPILRTLDAWAPSATLLWFFLALGHYFEGSDPALYPHHQPALYAAISAAILTLILLRRPSAPLALAATGLTQFLITFLRQPYPEEPIPALPLDPIQYAALAMLTAALILHLLPSQHEQVSGAPSHAGPIA